MSDNENYEDDDDVTVVYGTPLPELDEDSAAKKKKPIAIEDQIVTDENGRRRFHGAFTGGFSAGFFNTAGSRDGWSPAHFKSSRGKIFARCTNYYLLLPRYVFVRESVLGQ